MDIESFIAEVLGEDSEEYKLMIKCYNITSKSAPSTSSEAKNQMFILDSLRVQMSSLYFMVSRMISHYRESYQDSYNAQYTRLVKLGRPSHNAIEAEIKTTNPDYIKSASQIESYEQLGNLVNSYLKCIDECKRTAVEILRNGSRLD